MTSPTVFLDERYMLHPAYETRNYDLATDSRTMDFPASGILIAGTAMSASAVELNKMDGVTATTTELNLLDGSSATVPVVSTAAILDSDGALRTLDNVGTVPATVTAVEYGDGYNHTTVLTVTAAVFVPDVPADAEEVGALIYTFPAGVHRVNSVWYEVTAVAIGSNTNAVDFGAGSTLAAGDGVTLGAATDEDFLDGTTVANISTPTEIATIASVGDGTIFLAAGSKLFHLNMAGTWTNAPGAGASTVTGTVTINWTYLGA